MFSRREKAFSWSTFGAGFAAGLVAYFVLEPGRGAARRARALEKAASAARRAAERARGRAHDLAHRAHGLAHEARARLEEGEIADDILVERVRAQMGKPVSHPGALDVRVTAGRVILAGHILRHELEDLLSRVSRVRGVTTVENRLTVHDEPGSEPSLQRPGSRHWR